ncbi:MAG: lysophospholipid acyltransferase family protein [Pseudomonadota bacterium]
MRLFSLTARLPLAALHGMGGAMGWVTYCISGKYAARMRENIRGYCVMHPEKDSRRLLNASIAEAGKGIAELPWMWWRPLAQVAASVKASEGWDLVEAARARGKGLIFLTPHLGCFDVAALYTAIQMPLTVLYRPPKLSWLEPLMLRGRERAQLQLARTDLSGVRLLYKALKRGEAIGLLPDQVPGNGEGEWADFFGRPAYTMTLAGRLAQSSGAAVLMACAQRLPRGRGYVIHLVPMEFVPDLPVARQLNAALEQMISLCPEQYLWSYNRYKTPAGITPPQSRTGTGQQIGAA